jgi:hypothetical protein
VRNAAVLVIATRYGIRESKLDVILWSVNSPAKVNRISIRLPFFGSISEASASVTPGLSIMGKESSTMLSIAQKALQVLPSAVLVPYVMYEHSRFQAARMMQSREGGVTSTANQPCCIHKVEVLDAHRLNAPWLS